MSCIWHSFPNITLVKRLTKLSGNAFNIIIFVGFSISVGLNSRLEVVKTGLENVVSLWANSLSVAMLWMRDYSHARTFCLWAFNAARLSMTAVYRQVWAGLLRFSLLFRSMRFSKHKSYQHRKYNTILFLVSWHEICLGKVFLFLLPKAQFNPLFHVKYVMKAFYSSFSCLMTFCVKLFSLGVLNWWVKCHSVCVFSKDSKINGSYIFCCWYQSVQSYYCFWCRFVWYLVEASHGR